MVTRGGDKRSTEVVKWVSVIWQKIGRGAGETKKWLEVGVFIFFFGQSFVENKKGLSTFSYSQLAPVPDFF